MFIQSDKGLIIILGCSHAGVVNILDYITKITAQRRVYAIIGGMHLGQADDMRIQLTTDAFMALEVQKLIPLHCTGFRATAEMFWKMKDKCIIAGAGDVLEL
jgi:7,8-dihydropterin-6-yl-methyl-4-(beta-D-ribofuranosyl)aminobenzene 5'-phosphate synthase